jgi:ATP/maltotriose-dependent transcriptional regulator MalT
VGAHDLLVAAARDIAPVDRERAAALYDGAAVNALYHGDEAHAIAAAAAATRLHGAPTSRTSTGLCMAGRFDEAAPLFEAILATTPHDDPRALTRASDAAGWLGAHPAAYRFAVEAVTLARARGSPVETARAAQVALDQAMVAGDWAAALAYGHEAAAIGRDTGQRTIVAWSLWTLGSVLSARDEEAALTRALDELDALGRPLSWGAVRDAAATVRAFHHLGGGDASGAVAALDGAVDLGLEQVGNAPIPAAFELVEARFKSGDRHGAERDLERLAPHAHQPWATAALDRVRGLLATGEEGDALFSRAAATCEDHGIVFEEARARLLYGEWLRRRRRRLDARGQLRHALRLLDGMGARRWAAHALAELAATGETHAVRREGRPIEALSPQEYRIASLAAEGFANREIAQRLFLSTKTVEAHLHRTYLKLGIQRREQLPTAFDPG